LSPDNVEVIGGGQVSLEATVLPIDAANRTVTWSSSNPNAATVDSNGMVTTYVVQQPTTVVITATAGDGSGVVAEAKLVVEKMTVIQAPADMSIIDILLDPYRRLGFWGSIPVYIEGFFASIGWLFERIFGTGDPYPDRYSFGNASDSFQEFRYIPDSDFAKLERFVNNNYPRTEAQALIESLKGARRERTDGGTCYGMALTAILDKIGQIPMTEQFAIKPFLGTKTLSRVPKPIENQSVGSALDYYHISQFIALDKLGVSRPGGNKGTTAYENVARTLVATARAGKPQYFGFWGSDWAHLTLITGFSRENSDGSFDLHLYDSNMFDSDATVRVSKDYKTVSVLFDGYEPYGALSGIDTITDFSGFNNINLFASTSASRNVAAQSQSSVTAPQLQSFNASNSEAADGARLIVEKRGTATITNAEGKTIIYDSTKDSYTGTMEVYKMESFTGIGTPSTMTFTVPSSESFTFSSSVPGIGATVSDKAYSHASSDTAQTVIFKNYARVVEIKGKGNFDYRLFLIDKDDTRFDTMNVYGAANGNASLALNNDGSVLLSGVSASAEINTNNNPYYKIPPGHEQVQITGRADDIKAYAADGTEIPLQQIEKLPLKWWQTLPSWLQWVFRYVFFGWIWMK
jgi:hypothetical protein